MIMIKKTISLLIVLWGLLYWLSPVFAQDAEQAFKQAKTYYEQNDFTQAVPWLEKAASLGHADAQGLLGSMYLIGRGISKDVKLAIHWLQKAALLGHAEAQSLLGAIYLVGKDAPQDFVQAQQWLRQAAEQGLADAQYLLGMMYYQGNGVPQNLRQAYQWFSLAATQGHQAAIAIHHQLSSTSVPQDIKSPKLKDKYRLTVNVVPENSRVRIMNIKPKYKPGITLKPGQYDIYVTRSGYISQRMWVEIENTDLSIEVVLEPK